MQHFIYKLFVGNHRADGSGCALHLFCLLISSLLYFKDTTIYTQSGEDEEATLVVVVVVVVVVQD